MFEVVLLCLVWMASSASITAQSQSLSRFYHLRISRLSVIDDDVWTSCLLRRKFVSSTQVGRSFASGIALFRVTIRISLFASFPVTIMRIRSDGSLLSSQTIELKSPISTYIFRLWNCVSRNYRSEKWLLFSMTNRKWYTWYKWWWYKQGNDYPKILSINFFSSFTYNLIFFLLSSYRKLNPWIPPIRSDRLLLSSQIITLKSPISTYLFEIWSNVQFHYFKMTPNLHILKNIMRLVGTSTKNDNFLVIL